MPEVNSKPVKKYIPENAWAKESSPLPTCITRSGLFTPNQGERETFDKEPIASLRGEFEIIFSGPELRVNDDLEVLKYLIRKSRGCAIQDGVKFTKHEAVMEIFGSRSQNYVNMLIDSIRRMSSECSFTIYSSSQVLTLEGVRIIDTFGYEGKADNVGNRMVVHLHHKLIDLLKTEFTNLPIDREDLNPQSRKARDAILSLKPGEFIMDSEMRYEVLKSKANDKSYRTQFHKISDNLIKQGYLKSRMKVDHDGKILLAITEKTREYQDRNVKQLGFDFVDELGHLLD